MSAKASQSYTPRRCHGSASGTDAPPPVVEKMIQEPAGISRDPEQWFAIESAPNGTPVLIRGGCGGRAIGCRSPYVEGGFYNENSSGPLGIVAVAWAPLPLG